MHTTRFIQVFLIALLPFHGAFAAIDLTEFGACTTAAHGDCTGECNVAENIDLTGQVSATFDKGDQFYIVAFLSGSAGGAAVAPATAVRVCSVPSSDAYF